MCIFSVFSQLESSIFSMNAKCTSPAILVYSPKSLRLRGLFNVPELYAALCNSDWYVSPKYCQWSIWIHYIVPV